MDHEKKYSIDEIRSILTPLFVKTHIERAVLFGSYARNEATFKSDIDLFIDSGDRLQGFSFLGFCEDVKETLQKPVDVIEKRYINPSSELYQSILTDGVTIYLRGV